MTLRIVHVASAREWRGGQRQVWLLARELARQGAALVVVTGRASELAHRLEQDGVPVRPVRWSAGLDPRVVPAIMSELRHRPALVHAHDAHAVTLGGSAAALAMVPLVATRRVDFPLRRSGFWRRAARVIAISRAVANVLEADGIPSERIAVVHSGIALDDLSATTPLGVRARLGLPGDTRLAVNVAALVGHKDHATLLRAARLLAARFSSLHWIIAGDGPERRALEQLIGELDLGGVAHLLGHVAEPERLIAEADCFVMSSRDEGLGTSVLDAMALGIPVASTAAGGLPEMLDGGAGVLAPPGDSSALAEAVARLLSDLSLARATAERAKGRVKQFSAARMAAAVGTVYRSCGPFP
ncbi:MAG: glycosyltransferase [Gemmatimonadales bacterium]